MEASKYDDHQQLNSAVLPEDMMLEILLRLPVKSLIRFESVSKSWYHFLKTPYFKTMHHKFNLSSSASRLLAFSEGPGDCRNSYKFSFLSNDKSGVVLSPDLRIQSDPYTHLRLAPGSCNGIVCYYDHVSQIYLTNPTTRELKHLPPTCLRFETGDFSQIGIGLGFDSKDIYDLKVIRFFQPNKRTRFCEPTSKATKAEIYSLSSNSWKQLHWNLDDRLSFSDPSTQGLFYANSFHFFTEGGEDTIVCFDMNTETFRIMALPSLANRMMFMFLRLFKGFLSAVRYSDDMTSTEIWVMKEYGVVESWTKFYKIGSLLGGCLICCWTEEEDAFLMVKPAMAKLVSCNLNTNKFEPFEIDGYRFFIDLLVYKETLLSIM